MYVALQSIDSRNNKCDALRDLVPCVQFKKRENTYGGVLLLVKLQAEASKRNTPPWMFLTFFKLYQWYHVAQSVPNDPARFQPLALINLLIMNSKIVSRHRRKPKKDLNYRKCWGCTITLEKITLIFVKKLIF